MERVHRPTVAVALGPCPRHRGAGGPTARRAAVLAALFVALHALLQWRALDGPLFTLNTATADAAMAGLAAMGLTLTRDGTLVAHAGGFVTDVHQLCTLLLPAAVLAAGIAMHPHGRAGAKLAGALVGVAVVAVVNQCRLVGVIWVGVRAPDVLGLAHGWLAPAWLVALTLAYGWAWSRTVHPAVSPSRDSSQA